MTECIPLSGGPCHRCGYPADHVTVGERGRFVVHRDVRLPPCPLPNPNNPALGHHTTEPKGTA